MSVRDFLTGYGPPWIAAREDALAIVTPGSVAGMYFGEFVYWMPLAPRCSYCGRHGTLHANCDGCGAQVE